MIVGVPNGSAVENEISTVWEQILTGAVYPGGRHEDHADQRAPS